MKDGLWYDSNIEPYRGLAEIIAITIKNALISAKISFVDVPYRAKTKKSFLKKIEDKLTEKDYTPNSMTDLAGIRVITLIESDVQKVCDLIKSMFNVHPADSVNKSEKLGEEKVGYRSIHFVCDIGENRGSLPEFSSYKELCFEIQIRTALEHAWAEIEHDRGYKLGGKLPSHLNRRFKLLSGLLESADLEFNRLTVEINDYAEQIKGDITKNTLKIELSDIGITTLLDEKYSSTVKIRSSNDHDDSLSNTIQDLISFGIKNLGKLDTIIEESFKNYQFSDFRYMSQFLQHLMMIVDLDKYFEVTFSNNQRAWGHTGQKTYNFLLQKYSKEELKAIYEKHNLSLNITYMMNL